MGKLVPNTTNRTFDFVDSKGRAVTNVGDLLEPRKIVRWFDDKEPGLIQMEVFESGGTRHFSMRTDALASMEGFHQELFRNDYFINYKMVNPLREFITIRAQALQTAGQVEYKHRSLGFLDKGKHLYYMHARTRVGNSTSKHVLPLSSFEAGSRDDYLAFLETEIMPHENMQLALVLGLGSVLSSYLKRQEDIQTIIVNLCGPSSTGKTTTAKFIASLWGNPSMEKGGMVQTFNSTLNALFSQIENINGVPIVLDDLTTAPGLNKTDLAYQLAQGVARSRMSNYGRSIKQSRGWSGLAVITSELPLLSEAETRKGLLARVLDIQEIVWTEDGAHASRISQHINSCYGHLGMAFVEEFMQLPDERIKAMFAEAKDELQASMEKTDDLSERRLAKLAILWQTAKLTKELLDLSLDLDALKAKLVEIDQADIEERDLAFQGMEAIKHYIETNNRHFRKYDSNGTMHDRETGTLLGTMTFESKDNVKVCIPAENVKDILRDYRIFEYRVVLKSWAENGHIIQQSGRNTVNINALDSRVVRFSFERTSETIMPWFSAPEDQAGNTLWTNEEPPTVEDDHHQDDESQVKEIFGQGDAS